jgi:hypothetical protein
MAETALAGQPSWADLKAKLGDFERSLKKAQKAKKLVQSDAPVESYPSSNRRKVKEKEEDDKADFEWDKKMTRSQKVIVNLRKKLIAIDQKT